MDFKKLTFSVVFAGLLSAALIACSTEKKGGANPNNPGGCVGAFCGGVLPTGQKVGFFSQNALMDHQFPGGYNVAPMNVEGPFRNILKYAMSVCDRAGGSNGGLANCNSWMDGFHDMILIADGTQASTVKLVIRSYPNTQCSGWNCGWYSYQIPSFNQFVAGLLGMGSYAPVYNPLVLNATVWPINGDVGTGANSRGFALRAKGPTGSPTAGHTFELQVPNGKLEDSAWDYQLYFNVDNSSASATGRMQKCIQPNCAVPGL